MKLKKIVNKPALQVYRIINPSNKFKLKYPKQFTCILIERNSFQETYSIKYIAFDEIPVMFAFKEFNGYIFTYKDRIPPFVTSYRRYNGDDVYPLCLDQYFVNENKDEEKIDLLLNVSAKNKQITPKFKNDVILRCNSESLCNKVDITKDYELAKKNLTNNVLKIVNSIISEDSVLNVEEWVEYILDVVPLNNAGLPICYSDLIDDSSFTSKDKVSKSDITIGYDFRAKGYDYENTFISLLEDAFGTSNKSITIYESYNGILEKVEKALKDKGFKYKKPNDYSLEVSLKHLRELDIKYEITDFI